MRWLKYLFTFQWLKPTPKPPPAQQSEPIPSSAVWTTEPPVEAAEERKAVELDAKPIKAKCPKGDKF